jgi:hypothetical protein
VAWDVAICKVNTKLRKHTSGICATAETVSAVSELSAASFTFLFCAEVRVDREAVVVVTSSARLRCAHSQNC